MTIEDMLHEALEIIADRDETIERLMQIVWHYTDAKTREERRRVLKSLERRGIVTKLTAGRIARKVG